MGEVLHGDDSENFHKYAFKYTKDIEIEIQAYIYITHICINIYKEYTYMYIKCASIIHTYKVPNPNHTPNSINVSLLGCSQVACINETY